MNCRRCLLAVTLALVLALPTGLPAANHREAPITAFDHKADITDVYAFRSYDRPTPNVTMILCVDPLLEPANGPNWFPFDPDILYEIQVDNNNDAVEDIVVPVPVRYRAAAAESVSGLCRCAGQAQLRRRIHRRRCRPGRRLCRRESPISATSDWVSARATQ